MIPQTKHPLPSLLVFACSLLLAASGRADSVVNGVFTPTPTNHKFTYWGIDDGWQERLEEIQGVRFLNAAGAVQEAFQTMGNAGLNAVRVTVELGEPLTTTPLTGTGAQKEAMVPGYHLPYGGVDQQVDIARRAKAAGMKVIVTVDMGYDIPGPSYRPYGSTGYDHWQTDTYSQMLDDINAETVRLLDPFLQAGIQPDIFVVSNETDGGILGHAYDGHGDRSLGNSYYNLNNAAANDLATGDNTVYPKFVGFLKAQYQAAKAEIQRSFPGTAGATRYALHCKGGAPSWYYGRMFSSNPASESVATWNGQSVAVPAVTGATQINGLPSLPNLIDVLALSHYLGTPADGSQNAYATAYIGSGNESMDSFIADQISWGLSNNLSADGATYASGPYQGQSAKKCLILETDTSPASGSNGAAIEQQFVNYLAQQLALPRNNNLVLGAMWWEGTFSEFTGSDALYSFNSTTYDHQALPVLATWGQYGQPGSNLPYTLESASGSSYMTGGQYTGSWNFLSSVVPATSQTFHIGYNRANDTYTYTCDRDGGVLGAWDTSQGVGSHVELTPSSASPTVTQQLAFVSNGAGTNQILVTGTGLAFDNQGSPLFETPDASRTNPTQQWKLCPLTRYNLVNVANGLVLDSGLPNLFAGQYCALQQKPSNTVVSQQWSFVSDYNANLSPNVYYRIVNWHVTNANGNQPFLLSPWNNSTTVNDHVEQTALNTTQGIQPGQEWTFTAVQVNGGTAYRIINRNSGLALDAPSGPAIQAAPNNAVQTQLWQFVPSN